jgi:hypothetical protein
VTVFAALVVSFIATLALPAVSRRPEWRVRGLRLTSVVFASLAVLMTIYVLSEDDYRNDGRSRWTVYDAQEITVVAIVTAFLAAAVAIASIPRRSLAWVVALLAIGALSTNYAALAQMTN